MLRSPVRDFSIWLKKNKKQPMRAITNINLQHYLQTPLNCIEIHCNAFTFLQDQYICVRMEAISSLVNPGFTFVLFCCGRM